MTRNNLIKIVIFLALLFNSILVSAKTPLDDSTQMLLVIGNTDWSSQYGKLQRYERPDTKSPWEPVGQAIEVNFGQNGMGWGRGLHGNFAPTKIAGVDGPIIDREGLKRSPCGVFSLPLAFGRDSAASWCGKLKYRQITPNMYWSGDEKSSNYNTLVEDYNKAPSEDWKKGEHMMDYITDDPKTSVYDLGVFIGHNYEPVIKGSGSAFFLHVSYEPKKPGAGCTGVSREEAKTVVSWLDPKCIPVIVQLPHDIYTKVKDAWKLPDFPKKT